MNIISGRMFPDYPAGSRRNGWQDVSGMPGRIRPDYVIRMLTIKKTYILF
jgi:hypothetical protein